MRNELFGAAVAALRQVQPHLNDKLDPSGSVTRSLLVDLCQQVIDDYDGPTADRDSVEAALT